MTVSTRAQKKEILEYLLGECEVDEATVETLMSQAKIDTVMKLLSLSDNTIEDNQTEWGLADTEVITLKAMKGWLTTYYETHGSFPDTIEEYKVQLTGGDYGIYMMERLLTEGTTTQKQPAMSGGTLTSKSIAVKVSDFPEYNGKVGEYHSWSSKFQSVASLGGYDQLVNVEDWDRHDELLLRDAAYTAKNKELYDVLQNKTAEGTAATKVTKFKDKKDGARALHELKKAYDQGGDVKTFASKCLKELLKLEYHWNDSGGVDQYINNFNELLQEMEGLETLSDEVKKVTFLQGIKDKDFDFTKELCKAKTFEQAVDMINERAVEIGKVSGQRKIQRRRANKKTKQCKSREGTGSLRVTSTAYSR